MVDRVDAWDSRAWWPGRSCVIMGLGAMLPTVDFDAIEYHLQGPKEYYRAGRIAFLPHNVYTSMPFSIEMLHLLGMEVVGDWWLGALVGPTCWWRRSRRWLGPPDRPDGAADRLEPGRLGRRRWPT